MRIGLTYAPRLFSDAENRDVRLANNRIAAAVGTQMTPRRHAPDDQEVTLAFLGGSVQQPMHITTINDYFGLGAQILLKFSDLLRGVADEFLF